MNIPKIGKMVIRNCVNRWMASSDEAPRLAADDFETVRVKMARNMAAAKFQRLVGLYLKQNNYISGQFSQVWSVVGFHVMSSGIAWANESIYEDHKDICNIVIGALLAIGASFIRPTDELAIKTDSIRALGRYLKPSEELCLPKLEIDKRICSVDDYQASLYLRR